MSEVKVSCGSGAGRAAGSGPQDQLEMVQDVLKKLAQEEERLAREKRAREHDIHVRYATLLRHAGEARDASLVSLRDVTQALNDALQSEVTLARGVLHRMKQSAIERQASSSSFSESEDLTEANRRHFEELLQKKEEEALLNYEDLGVSSTQSLIQALRDFMSRVVAAGQVSDSPLDTDMTCRVATDPQLQASDGAVPSMDFRDLASKMKHLTSRCSLTENLAASLQTQNALLYADLASVRDKNSTLCADIAALQREMASLRDTFGDDFTSLKRDLASVRDKNSLLGQENQQLRHDVNTLQTDQTKFQADQDKLRADQDKLQADQDKLRADQDKLQADQDKLRADHDKFMAEQDKLKADRNSFVADLGTVKNDVGRVIQKNCKMELNIASVQDLLKKDSVTLPLLETKLCEYY